jgi:tetratricopeptide (TPR) repeat protein
LEAAEAICTEGDICLDTLTRLVDQSLVVFGFDPQSSRYRMHETIRQYARQQLHASGEESEVSARHAHFYAQLVMNAVANPQGSSLQVRLDLIDAERDNLRPTFNWTVVHDPELSLQLVAGLGNAMKFWELRGHYEEGRRWLRRILDATTGTVSESRATALLAAAGLSSAINDFEYGLSCASESQHIFEQLQNLPGVIDARLNLANLKDYQGEQTEATTEVQAALALAEQIDYRPGLAKGGWLMGSIIYDSAEYDRAIQYLLPSIALWRELDRSYELALALNTLAACLLEKDDYISAREVLEETVEINRKLGYQRGVALALHNLAETELELGDYVRSQELNTSSLEIRCTLGLRRGYAFSLENFAILAERQGQYPRAVQLFAAAQALRQVLGAPNDPVTQEAYNMLLAEMRTRLGDIRYELDWSKGWAMTADQAIDLALR